MYNMYVQSTINNAIQIFGTNLNVFTLLYRVLLDKIWIMDGLSEVSVEKYF